MLQYPSSSNSWWLAQPRVHSGFSRAWHANNFSDVVVARVCGIVQQQPIHADKPWHLLITGAASQAKEVVQVDDFFCRCLSTCSIDAEMVPLPFPCSSGQSCRRLSFARCWRPEDHTVNYQIFKRVMQASTQGFFIHHESPNNYQSTGKARATVLQYLPVPSCTAISPECQQASLALQDIRKPRF